MLLATLQIVSEIPSTYESRAVLIISERESMNEAAMNAHIAAARQRATSTGTLQFIVDRHHLRGADESTDAAINRLREEIKIETKLTVLTVSYRHKDPRLAQAVVTDVVSAFDQTNEEIRKRATAEAGWLDSQIVEIEDQLAKIGLPSAASASPGTATDTNTARAALTASIDELNDKQYTQEQQIAEQKRQILAQRGIVESAQSAPGPQDAAYGALLVRKTELEAQLLEYASQYTDKNVKVIQARTQLLEINRQLAALEAKNQSGGAAAAPAIRELLALERDLIRLQSELEITGREIGRKEAALKNLPKNLPKTDQGVRETETRGDYDRLISNYHSLLGQRDLMRKAGALDDGGPALFRISDPPNLPQEPAGPKRLVLGGLALAFALGTALLMVGIVEVRQLFLVQDHVDVAYFLGMPLLGTIPETLTPVERSLKRRLMLVRAFCLVLLVSAAPATVLALKHFDLLKKVLPF